MSGSDITYLTDVVLITCVVANGRGDAVIRVARDAGVPGAFVYGARGSGLRERLGLLGIAVEAEKDVVSMLAASEDCDRIMHTLYSELALDRPGSGVIYAVPLDRMATYLTEDMRQKLA